MSAGYPAPIQAQPQWQNGSTFSKSTAMVPPGLECLVEVEEVILKDRVFQTKDGQDLFTAWRESKCCGPSLNLHFRTPYKRDVVTMYLSSDGGCCGAQTLLKVNAQPSHHIGNVRIVSYSSCMNVSIERGNGEPVFSAKLPLFAKSNNDSTIEICNMDGSQPVAFITKEKEGKSSRVIFHFPLNMEATLKAVILAAYLYASFRMREVSHHQRSSDNDFGWASAGGVDFADMSHGDFGDWGGGGDCGGGGGDFGGGDCGGGGGDCGGGGCGD